MADSVADTEAIRRYVAGIYAALSFREGAQPNWEALRGLFWPGAQIIQLRGAEPASQTPAEYIAALRSRIAHGELRALQEREAAATIKVQGDLAQVFSQFEARLNGGAALRGVNAFQLVRHAGRWLCVGLTRSEEAAPVAPERRIVPATAPQDRPYGARPYRPGGPPRGRR